MGMGKASLLGTVQQIIDCLGVENVSVSFAMQASLLNLRLECRDMSLRSGRADGFTVKSALLYIEGFDPELPPKEALLKSTIRVEKLVLCLAAALLNRVLNCNLAKTELAKLPVEISGLSIAMAGERLSLRGKVRKGFVFPFAIELKPEAVNDNLRVVFENFWAAEMVPMPGFLRRLLMSVAKGRIAAKEGLRGVVSIDDDAATINPWSKIPCNVSARLRRFGVEGHYLVLELGAVESAGHSDTLNDGTCSNRYSEAELDGGAGDCQKALPVSTFDNEMATTDMGNYPVPVVPTATCGEMDQPFLMPEGDQSSGATPISLPVAENGDEVAVLPFVE